MDEASLVPVVDHLQQELSKHIVSNNMKFADIDETLNWLSESRTAGKGTTMADGTTDTVNIKNHAADPNAAMMAMMPAMMASGVGKDGFLGGGGGLLGGLLLGSLLRNGGGLFGGNGNGGMTDVTQPSANMSIMSTLGDIKQAVAVGTAQMETSQALQSSTIQAQLSGVAAALTNTVGGVKDSVNQNTVALMQMINGVTAAIGNDGDKTRAILVQQNEANLNRQLATANAEVIELRNDLRGDQRARTTEINVNQNVNQQQQQQQQQVLLDRVNQVLAAHQYLQQGIVNLGTMTGNSQSASNTRVN